MKIIGWGTISIYHIHPFISSVFYLIRSYAFMQLQNKVFNSKKNDPVFLTLIMFLGELVFGIVILIEELINRNKRFVEKKKKKKKAKTFGRGKITVIKNVQSSKITNALIILVVAGIEFIAFYSFQYIFIEFPKSSDFHSGLRPFKLISDSIFAYLILKCRVYRHHYLSISILVFGILFNINEDHYDIVLQFIFPVIFSLISIGDTAEKWLIDHKFINPINILFYRGVFGASIATILGLFHITWKGNMSLCESFDNIFSSDWKAIFWFSVYFFCSIFYNFFCSITKLYFYPSHIVVFDCFSTIIWRIILDVIGNEQNSNWGLILTGYFLVVFGCMLYHAFVILYFCGFEIHTKYEVDQRSLNEKLELEIMEFLEDNPVNNNNVNH